MTLFTPKDANKCNLSPGHTCLIGKFDAEQTAAGRKRQEKVEKAGKSGKSREKQEKENSAFRGGAFVGRGVEWTPGVSCLLSATTVWQKHHTLQHKYSSQYLSFDK